MSDVKWIKLSTDIFDNRKIRQIEKMPDGDAIIVIWLKLLILAGCVNDGGLIYFTRDIPYTEQLLATHFDKPLAVVQFALKTFEQFDMIQIVDKLILVSNWEKYQNVDGLEKVREKTRERVAKHRRLKQLEARNVTCNVTVTPCNATDIDIERDIEKELDIKESVGKKKPKKTSFVPPTLEEVTEYVRSRNSSVDPVRFFDYYSEGDWKDGKGVPVRNWKQKLLTWERRDRDEQRGRTCNARQSAEADSRFADIEYDF